MVTFTLRVHDRPAQGKMCGGTISWVVGQVTQEAAGDMGVWGSPAVGVPWRTEADMEAWGAIADKEAWRVTTVFQPWGGVWSGQDMEPGHEMGRGSVHVQYSTPWTQVQAGSRDVVQYTRVKRRQF